MNKTKKRHKRNKKRKTRKTRKRVPWAGWAKLKPRNLIERKKMYNNCGKKCFLGNNLSYPICKRNSCNINKKGIHAAHIRASAHKNNRVVKKVLAYLKKNPM